MRHIVIASVAAVLVYAFYLSYGAWGVEPALWPAWDQDHPLWRAFAHTAYVLLVAALAIGPAARLWRPAARALSWRRELGIWFAITSLAHGYVILERWARFDLGTLFGFEFVSEIGRYVLVRPEVATMNLMGVVALPMIVLLALTSNARAARLLGSGWSWLHGSLVQALFYVLVLRGVLYLFLMFQYSPPNWRFYPPIWFLYVFLGLGLALVILQAAAFAATVLRQASRRSVLRAPQVAAVIAVAALWTMPMVLTTVTVAYFDARVIEARDLMPIE